MGVSSSSLVSSKFYCCSTELKFPQLLCFVTPIVWAGCFSESESALTEQGKTEGTVSFQMVMTTVVHLSMVKGTLLLMLSCKNGSHLSGYFQEVPGYLCEVLLPLIVIPDYQDNMLPVG